MLRAEESRLRARVDDGTAILEMWHGCLGHVEVAVEIRAHRHVELLFRDFFDRFGMTLEGCVVHQDVEAAELVDRVVDRVLAEGRVTDIACDRDATSTFGFDRAAGLPGIGVLAQVDDRHICTLAGEEHCHCPANARISTGDERNHPLELAAAYVGRRLIVWLRVHLMLGARLGEVLLGHGAVGLPPVARLHGLLGCRIRFRFLRLSFPRFLLARVFMIDPFLDLALLTGGLLRPRAVSVLSILLRHGAAPPFRWPGPASDHRTSGRKRADVDRRRDRASVASYARAM